MATHASRIIRTTAASSIQYQTRNVKHYPVVVLGGGSGGCSMASRLCRLLGQGNVAVVEPSKFHWYQPMFTLIGAGVTTVNQSEKLMTDVLPKQCVFYQTKAEEFDPESNQVTLASGDVLSYRYLVIALGLELNYTKVEGLLEALESDPMVCSNYARHTVEKTFPALQSFKGGNAIFTVPNTPIKCAGASHFMYLADECWRKNGVRAKTNITFKTSKEVVFGVQKYAERISEVIEKKDIDVDFKRNLIAVDHKQREATFQLLDSGEIETCKFDFIHIAPPMSAPKALKNSKTPIVDETGYLAVDKHTLQHVTYPNIFGLGDCTNLPTSKTAAAISSQSTVLLKNISDVVNGEKPKKQKVLHGNVKTFDVILKKMREDSRRAAELGLKRHSLFLVRNTKYDGYTSCPVVTGYNKCILPEFDYNGEPLETFPFNQSKESWLAFQMKEHLMPELYWKGLLTGHWNGPKPIRRMMHLGLCK